MKGSVMVIYKKLFDKLYKVLVKEKKKKTEKCFTLEMKLLLFSSWWKKNIKHKSVFYRNKKDDVKKFKRKCLLGGQTIKHSINYWKMKKSICFFFSFLLKYEWSVKINVKLLLFLQNIKQQYCYFYYLQKL